MTFQRVEAPEKEHLWTWGGRYVGYRAGAFMFTSQGHNLGRFEDEQLFAPDGRYLGDLRIGRLIRNVRKRELRIKEWPQAPDRQPIEREPNQVRYRSIQGFEDFSSG